MQYCRRYLVRRLASNTHLSHPYDVRSRAKNGARWRTRERIQMHGCGRRGKKAGGNHDQARIWASKVRVRTQLRTRNAITRVSKSPSRSGRPFLACLPPPSLLHRVCTEERARKVRPSVRGHVWLGHRKKLDLSAVRWSELKKVLPYCS